MGRRYVRFSPRGWRVRTSHMRRDHRAILFEIGLENWLTGTAVPLSRLAELFADLPRWQRRVIELLRAEFLQRDEVGAIYDPIASAERVRDVNPRADIDPERWAELRAFVFKRDGYICRYCGSGPPLECDHVHPFSRGGATDETNLVTACRPCNRKKRAKALDELGWTLRPLEGDR